MSRNGSVSFIWADGEHTFRLGIGQLRELQEKCDAGPAHILQRIDTGQWLVDDLRETLRLGLIGGGMSPADAVKMVTRYVDERPLLESCKPAMAVLLAALVGAEDEPLGKEQAAEMENPPSREESSASPLSTVPGPQWDTAPEKLTA